MSTEQSYIMVKPEGVQRGLVGEIILRFERRGYKLIALKMVTASRQLLESHYGHLKDKPFFKSIITHIYSGPVVCMVWEGIDVVQQGRSMLGETNPLSSKPGTIRGDYGISTGRNICHGSDSVENAKREIKMWFGEGDLQKYSLCSETYIIE